VVFVENMSKQLGIVVVGRQTRDREIASSTPGQCIAGYG